MIENHVCSLVIAKKLKDLGMKQESLFFYFSYENPLMGFVTEDKVTEDYWVINSHSDKFSQSYDWKISAFTASELLDMLPNTVTIKELEPFDNYRLEIKKSLIYENEKINNKYSINYYCDTTESHGENAWFSRRLTPSPIYDTNLANAAAKMIIYLIENKLYDPK